MSEGVECVAAEQSAATTPESGSTAAAEVMSVKQEPRECLVCGRWQSRWEKAAARAADGETLAAAVQRVRGAGPVGAEAAVCEDCATLVRALLTAEAEYCRLKATFLILLDKNPHYTNSQLLDLNIVKSEADDYDLPDFGDAIDSEDEPLATTKQRRNHKSVKKKKKLLIDVKPDDLDITEESWMNMRMKERVAEQSLDLIKTEDNGIEQEAAPAGARRRGRPRKPATAPRAPPRAAPPRPAPPSHACDQCSARFSTLGRLERHRARHAERPGPPYVCEVCGARYKHRRACEVHVAMHNGISDWKCLECDKLFPSKAALQRHNNIHTGKPNYQCDLCGKSFIHTSSFKMHKLSHSGLKPHKCPTCGLALMTSSHLKRHLRIHSGEKRYQCALCGKRFSERYNLVAHARSHAEHAGHAGLAAPAAPGPPAPPAARRRLFRCQYCPERFERMFQQEAHVSAAHGASVARAPPRPRNTMSKLLKATAAAAADSQRGDKPPPSPAPAPAPAASPGAEREPAAAAAAAGAEGAARGAAEAWLGGGHGFRPHYM